MPHVRLKFDPAQSNQEIWNILEKMMVYGETLGPKLKIQQPPLEEDGSVQIDVFGESEQISSIRTIIEEIYAEMVSSDSPSEDPTPTSSE